MDISEKNETKVHWITLSRHQVLSIDILLRLLVWQQSRIKMAENVHLIQFISQKCPVTPDIFCIKTFLHLYVMNKQILKKFCRQFSKKLQFQNFITISVFITSTKRNV